MDYRAFKRSSISLGRSRRFNESFQRFAGMGIYQNQAVMLDNSRGAIEQQSQCVCSYEHNSALFALDWDADDHVAVGSYKEDSFNKLSILEPSADLLYWKNRYQANVLYPISRIQWMPEKSDKLATCSDSLRVWSVDETLEEQINLSLVKYGKNIGDNGNSRTLGQLPPVTSFDWNKVDTNILLSSSVDTTCTIWDLQAPSYLKTQLIAHDSEVFDTRFLTQSSNLFSSCGGDGSVRVFDLRCLAHSTIIYEPQRQDRIHTPSQIQMKNSEKVDQSTVQSGPKDCVYSHLHCNNALLRLEPSPFDANILATIKQDSSSILILDMRYPGSPISTLDGHKAAVNQIRWHPSEPDILLSCADDCQILYWDLKQLNSETLKSSIPEQRWFSSNNVCSMEMPQMSYTAQFEVNNIVWRPKGNWVGYVAGNKFCNLKL